MDYSWFDYYLMGESIDAYKYLGCHFITKNKKRGAIFRVYAPMAREVHVIGEFNDWDLNSKSKMEKVHYAGLYELFIPDVKEYQSYKFHIQTQEGNWIDKADPCGYLFELRPGSCTRTFNLEGFVYHDEEWLKQRDRNFDKAVSIYEMHLGSWLGKANDNSGRFLSCEEIAPALVKYVKEMGFTHVEFMPVTQYPFDGSWGYQVVGYYATDSRYGNPFQFMHLIDVLHQNGIGVILDFVPVHFAVDNYGLSRFDGSAVYEYNNDNEYSQWGTKNFDLGKDPVRSFLMSSINMWIEKFHVDGIRMDAISNVIYYDGNSDRGVNQGGVDFVKRLNYKIHEAHDDIMMIAEDSSAYGQVTKGFAGGLLFDYKWDLGWMNDTLKYYQKDPIYRKYIHNQLTFSMAYFYSENFLLPLSHDEVVYGKGTILNKMFGDNYDNKFAQVCNLYAYQFAHPGKKLNFMGNELASWDEWNENKSLPWELQKFPKHSGVSRLIRDLNLVYRSHVAMHKEEYSSEHFSWIMADNADQSIFVFKREVDGECLIFIFNMTPNFYSSYDIGVPYEGTYEEIINTDKDVYGGWNHYNGLPLTSSKIPLHNQPNRISLMIGSFAGIYLRYVNPNRESPSLNDLSENDKMNVLETEDPAKKAKKMGKKGN